MKSSTLHYAPVSSKLVTIDICWPNSTPAYMNYFFGTREERNMMRYYNYAYGTTMNIADWDERECFCYLLICTELWQFGWTAKAQLLKRSQLSVIWGYTVFPVFIPLWIEVASWNERLHILNITSFMWHGRCITWFQFSHQCGLKISNIRQFNQKSITLPSNQRNGLRTGECCSRNMRLLNISFNFVVGCLPLVVPLCGALGRTRPKQTGPPREAHSALLL